MTVQELIIELLDCEMDADVSVLAESKEGDIEEEEIDIVRNGRFGREYVELQVSTDQVIIDESDYEEMEKRIEELEES